MCGEAIRYARNQSLLDRAHALPVAPQGAQEPYDETREAADKDHKSGRELLGRGRVILEHADLKRGNAILEHCCCAVVIGILGSP
jgi:hypothetical protein